MIKVQEFRGHIRNWEELCERLGISLDLSREEREEEILVRAYETWGYEMADHMHGMFASAPSRSTITRLQKGSCSTVR